MDPWGRNNIVGKIARDARDMKALDTPENTSNNTVSIIMNASFAVQGIIVA
jgi:hypothetical protein